MNIKVDKIESDDLFDKFINNLIKCLYNFLEQLENYYQAYLSIVLGVNLKESLNHEHKKVESKYNDLKVRLTEFLAVITRDSAEIKQKFNEIKLLKENYEFYTNLMKKVSNNENNSDINNITSMYGYIQGQLNELISVQYNKIIKLNNFKFYLKHGSIEYQSYSDQKIFSIPIKHLMKDLKKSIQKIGVDKEIKKEYSTLKKSFHEIESLSSYSDFTPLQSIEDTLTDAGSLHVTSETKKRKRHSTIDYIDYRSEVATDTRNVKKKKARDIDDSDGEDNDNDDDDDLIKSNSEDEQVILFQNEKIPSNSGDQVQNILKRLSKREISKKHRSNRNRGRKIVPSSRFVLESVMPDNVPHLMNIDDQDSISKEYYETTLQLLGEKLKTIDEVNNYLIIHENDKLCKEYHVLKKELDHREKQLFKTKEQVDQIENIRKVSGDNSTNIQKNLIKEREELKRIRHEINDKKSRVKKIQKLIRKLDKNDYDLQNDKHVLYNGMRKLIEHWLLQIQNELDQEINVERQIELQDDIEKAKEKLALIVADINDMYLSYNKRKKNRMLTDFDYENFCEYSTFTECLLRYDTSSKNDNNNAMVAI